MSACRARRLLGAILCSLALTLVTVPSAVAGMIPSERVLSDASPERQALAQALERDEVRAQLEQLGVDARDARRRVARMTDAEVTHLHQRVASLPAGGDISTVELLLIIILIILIV